MGAGKRGVDVGCALDTSHTLTGSTTWQVERLSEMKSGGVKVMLSRGVSGNSGIQHSKTVLSEEEEDMLVALNEAGIAAHDERLRYIKEHSQAFTEELEKAGREPRSQRAASREHKSVPPSAERYRTAKRFNIARARTLHAEGRAAKDKEVKLAV